MEFPSSCSEPSKLAVVSIVGPAGFGKTSLAKHVINDGEVEQHFRKRIWVCVSEEFDEASIMKKMIEAATEEAPSVGELEALQRKINKVLKDKLFLIVLDDVWNEDYGKWEKLFNAINNCGLRGSRLLVTTRSKNVCQVVGGHTFHVGIISSFEHCWSIFESVAFENRNESERPELRMVGEEIVKKCKGVPLAIKTVAGALRTKSTIEDWKYVLKSDMWDWQPKSETGILPALFLSYYHLSPPLKQCFRYCAIYPKDYRISKDEIVPQWIAHGYILEKKNMEMEDVAENYFDELVACSLFQEPELDKYDINNITHCKMHDLVHDLALFVTKGEFVEENIASGTQYPPLHCRSTDMELLNNIKIDVEKLRTFMCAKYVGEIGMPNSQIDKMQHVRVLELHGWNLENVVGKLLGKLLHLRYLNLWGSKVKDLPSSIGELQNLLYLDLTQTSIEALPESFGMLRKLRHLDLSGNQNLKALPSTIGSLTNLRKLELKETGLERIPDCIGELGSLQVLDVSYCKNLEKLPESIKDLSRLQVLNVYCCTILEQLPAGTFDKMTGSRLQRLPAGIRNLTRLQRLDKFVTHEEGSSSSSSSSSSNICELRDLNHLHGSLTILNLDTVASGEEAASAQLQDKTFLTRLLLKWNTDDRREPEEKTTSEDVLGALRPCPTLHVLWIVSYPGCTVPTWLGNSTALMLSGLRELYLYKWDGCTDLPALGNLPELRRLQIVGMPKVRRVGAEWFGSNHGFPKLEYLLFGDMAEWEEWDILLFFPCVSKLHISHCPKLRSLPPILSTSSLREIDVVDCSNLSNWLEILPASIVTLGSISAEWVNGLPSLPNLEHLKISGDDAVWELSNHLVNKLGTLKTLEISCCPNLEFLPQEMASLKQLQKLDIYNCPKLKESCNMEGAQWYKIKHIPSILIDYRSQVRGNA